MKNANRPKKQYKRFYKLHHFLSISSFFSFPPLNDAGISQHQHDEVQALWASTHGSCTLRERDLEHTTNRGNQSQQWLDLTNWKCPSAMQEGPNSSASKAFFFPQLFIKKKKIKLTNILKTQSPDTLIPFILIHQLSIYFAKLFTHTHFYFLVEPFESYLWTLISTLNISTLNILRTRNSPTGPQCHYHT